MPPISTRRSQENRILWILEAAWPNWTPAPELSKISLQYGRAIYHLRKQGWAIANKVEIVNGVRHGSFRLGSRPVRSSRELRQDRPPVAASKPEPDSLFGDISPDRSYRE